MNRTIEYVKSLSNESKEQLIEVLIKNAPDEIPCMKDMRQDLDIDKVDAATRARMIFFDKKQYPKITISKMCYDYGISETTYKKHKSIHLKEWEAQYNTATKDDMLFFAFDYAADGNLDDWKTQFGTAPISLFTIPETFTIEQPKPSAPVNRSSSKSKNKIVAATIEPCYISNTDNQKISTIKEREMMYI